MAKKDKDGLKSALKTVGRVGQLGFTFAFTVFISVGIGIWLDNLAGTDILFKLIFLFVGLLSGGWNVYKSLSRYLWKDK